MGDPTRPKGDLAAKARQRKYALLRELSLPQDGLPGSLSLTHRRCGKPTCHCAEGRGHPQWQLTYMQDGRKRVERIPLDRLDEVRRRVERAQAYRKGVGEIFIANAELLVQERKQRRGKKGTKRK